MIATRWPNAFQGNEMTLQHSKSALMVCTALTVLALASPTAAQTAVPNGGDGQATQLKEIVVKGKRADPASAASDTPLATQTTAEQLRKRGISNIRDLGNTTEPGVDFVENKPGKTGGLFIRGLTGARVVTLVDGIPLPLFENYARNGQATTNIGSTYSSFDFGSLSAVDVVRGADSSRLGSGALGGALVLKTLQPSDLIEDGRDWGGVAKTAYDSEDRGFGGDVAVAKKIENTSVLFQAAYRRGHESRNKGDDDILGTKRTKSNPADSHQNNLLFKVEQEIEGGHKIGVTAERYEKEIDVNLKTMHGVPVLASAPSITFKPGDYAGYDNTLRQRISLNYDFEAPATDSVISDAYARLYWQSLDLENGSGGLRSDLAPYSRDDRYQTRTIGLSGGLTSKFNTGDVAHTLRFGGDISRFDFEEDFVSVTSTAVSSKKDMPEVSGKKLGLYLEDELAFAETGFKLTPGVRFDYFDYNPSGDLNVHSDYKILGLPRDRSGSRFSPKLLATYDLTPEVELFAQWSMAYRAPSINELYVIFPNITTQGYAVVGNADLSPETSNGFELGANYSADDITGRVTVFHNRYKNFIDHVSHSTTLFTAPGGRPGTLNTFSNRENVEMSGVEVRARKEFANGFFAHGSLAYTYGKDTDKNEFIRTVAPFKSVLGLGYAAETWGTELTGIFSAGMRESESFKDNRGQTVKNFDAPGYGLFNLSGWWEPEQTKGLRIQAGVYNIFDKTYYNAVGVRDVNILTQSTMNQPVAFYSEPGRTFKISLTQKF